MFIISNLITSWSKWSTTDEYARLQLQNCKLIPIANTFFFIYTIRFYSYCINIQTYSYRFLLFYSTFRGFGWFSFTYTENNKFVTNFWYFVNI